MLLLMLVLGLVLLLVLIEPAEPEPPAAHLIGRVDEEVMGRSGQIVKPCWLAAGGVALVVRNWWRGWRSGLLFLCFLLFLVILGMENHAKLLKAPKISKRRPKPDHRLGSQTRPKIKCFGNTKTHQTRTLKFGTFLVGVFDLWSLRRRFLAIWDTKSIPRRIVFRCFFPKTVILPKSSSH